jgi:prepilin-type N-terminal cleavage/methylation domain-containing protein
VPAGDRGFTLVELLVAMAILGIMIAAAMPLLSTAVRRSSDVDQRVQIQAEVRTAVEQLERDLRQAYSGTATAPVEAVSAGSITFLSPDRNSPFHLRRVSYRVTGGLLERASAVSTDTDGAPWIIPPLGPYAPVVRSIVDPAVFTFQDENGVATTNPALVRSVGVRFVVSAARNSGTNFVYQSSVHLRAVQ